MAEQAGRTHPVLAALSAQFACEIDLFAVFGAFRFLSDVEEPAVLCGGGYLAGRGGIVAGILDILDSAGVRPDRARTPYFVDEATSRDGGPAACYSSSAVQDVLPGAVAGAQVQRWFDVVCDPDPFSVEFHPIFRAAAHVTSREGYDVGVGYVLDLLDAGQVLQPDVAGYVAAALMAAAGRGLALDEFTEALWDDEDRGDWGAARVDQAWLVPGPAAAPMAPLVSAVLERVITAKAEVLASTTLDDWLINLHRFRRLAEAVDAAINTLLESPSITTRAILSQLEENRADFPPIMMLEEGHGFHRVVDDVQRIQGEMAATVGWEEAGRRFHAERRLFPDRLSQRPTPADWFTPTWRIAWPWRAWRSVGGPSPFTRAGPGENYFGSPMSDEQQVMSKLAEITQALESGEALDRGLPLATRLIYDFPWCDLAYWKAGQCYFNLANLGYLDAAIEFMLPTLALQPLQPVIWESLALCLEQSGDLDSARVVGRVAEFVQAEIDEVREPTDDGWGDDD